jgi:hypothetical protein
MNVACTVKGQLIWPIITRYKRARKTLKETLSSDRDKNSAPDQDVYPVDFDFQSLQQIPASTDTLQRLLFDKISVAGPSFVVTVLFNGIDR